MYGGMYESDPLLTELNAEAAGVAHNGVVKRVEHPETCPAHLLRSSFFDREAKTD